MKKLCGIMSAALLIVLLFSYCARDSLPSDAREPYRQIKKLSISEGKLNFLGEMERVDTLRVYIYQDESYTYYYNIDEKGILSLNANSEMQIYEEAGSVDDERVKTLTREIFPWINIDGMTIEWCEPGSHLEAHRCSAEEYEDDIRLNMLSFSFSADGRLVYAFATHNIIKDNFEYIVERPRAEEIAIDHLKAEQEDINYIKATKIVHNGAPVWLVDCALEMGELDGYYFLYIDAQTGEILQADATNAQ